MNVIDETTRPAPPTPTARKGNPLNAEFEEKAKRFLRDAMAQKGVTYDQLTERLASIGVDMSKGGVANKISRGGFSAAFLLQCIKALDLEIEPVEK
ncbi:DUF6471 domain-containing protein [Marinovum sp. SP66]|uniref:DUF6471 domain-containing protein n=1 Tax=Marinovum TaxID=367771 RepID=UPI00237AAB81|nr:DUF6471 domain-containing protein [Marinovum sp. SP66]MDD9739768.1 DUF6471 domain-containing protein [Marinovum sp. SP66]